jgi:hypothetical protein
MSTLGCGQYEVYFKSRGGGSFISRALNLTEVSWGRKLNDTSEASVSFSLRGVEGDCCDAVSGINPWQHELAVYRDGEEVWGGPITGGELNQASMSMRFDAKDLSAWFDRRWVEIAGDDKEFEEADITEVFDWLIAHAYYKDPWNMSWYFNQKLGIPIDRTYVGYTPPDRWGGNYPIIGSELRDLSNSGIDYTVVRRAMLAGDLRDSKNVSGRILDKHWVTLPNIIIVGTTMGTEVAVAGGNGGFYGWDNDQIWIERPYDQEREQYGLLQYFESAASLDEAETTALPNAVTQRAYNLRQLRKKPFEYINGGDLSADAPFTFDELVPGNYFRVDMTQSCRTIESNYLLTGVNVVYTADSEKIGVEMVPPGSEGLRG